MIKRKTGVEGDTIGEIEIHETKLTSMSPSNEIHDIESGFGVQSGGSSRPAW